MPTLRDSDLMMLADGELDPTEAAELEAMLGPEERAKIAVLRHLGEQVRGHLELSADDAETRLAGMWDEVDKRLSLEAAPAVPAAPVAPPTARSGLWSRIAGWLDEHRGHFLTGALSAGAVAALILVLGPPGERVVVERTAQRPPPIEIAPVPVPTAPVVLASSPPTVESLDVAGGTGTVFTVEDEDGAVAVIWVTPEDTVEGL